MKNMDVLLLMLGQWVLSYMPKSFLPMILDGWGLHY